MGRRILSRRRPGCKSRPGCPRPPALPTLLGRAASPSNSDGTASTSVRGGGRARAYGRRAAPVATVPTGHSDGRSESSESESFSPAPLLVFTSVCSSACQADGSRRPRRRAMAPASLRGSQEEAAPLRARKHRPRPGSRSPRRCAVGPLRGSREEASPLRRRRPRAVGPCALAREEGGGRTASREEGARRRLALVEAGAGRTVRCADRAVGPCGGEEACVERKRAGTRLRRVPWAPAALCGRGSLRGEEAAPLRAEKVAVNG